MKGVFWNVRGLNKPGRNLSLGQLIRENPLDFVGVQETKKEEIPLSFLKNLTSPAQFCWNYLPARGSSGGILLGVREESFVVSNVALGNLLVSCLV
jgi:exonuclease III